MTTPRACQPSFAYRQLGERLRQLKERKDASDQAIADRLRQLQLIADEAAKANAEPERLDLRQPGEYELFMVLRAHASGGEEANVADCARQMVAHLRKHRLLHSGWSMTKTGRMAVERSLLAESMNDRYEALGLDTSTADPAFLQPAIDELAKTDGGAWA